MMDGDDSDIQINFSVALLIFEVAWAGLAEYNHKFHVMFAVRSCREQGV